MSREHEDWRVHDHFDSWDEGDVTALIKARSEGKTAREIASVLGRTPAAVYAKVQRLKRQGIDAPKIDE